MPNTARPRTGSLAARHRPRAFADVVGQRHVVVPLQKAVRNDRLPRQILFSGGSGLGKTTLARIVSAAVLCETPMDQRPDGEVCGACENCLDILTPGRSHPDVVEFDAASHGGKDEIRAIAETAMLTPMRGDWRVYIIDEAHGLSNHGGQAFLKLLEEPPAHVLFFLATTDPHKMLQTNRGRCSEFELTPPPREQLVENLSRVAVLEGWDLYPEVAEAVVATSDPQLGVRGTLMTLEKLAGVLDDGGVSPDAAAELLGVAPQTQIDRIVAAIRCGDARDALTTLEALLLRFPAGQVRLRLANRLRAALVDVLGRTPVTDSIEAQVDALRAALAALIACPDDRLALEACVVGLCRPQRSPIPEITAMAHLEASASRLEAVLTRAHAEREALIEAVRTLDARRPGR